MSSIESVHPPSSGALGEFDYVHVLEGDADIKSAANIAAGLIQALKDYSRIAIDARAIKAADITTVQSLLAARLSARAQGKSIVLAAPLSEPLATVLKNSGLLSPEQPHRDFWPISSEQRQDARR
jgi:hypothetical protein